MKVMHLLPSLASGGVEQVVLELCQGLTEQGIENIVVSAGGAMVPAIEEAGAKHHLRPIGKKSLFTLLQIGKLAKLIKTEKPDILHLHSRVPAWVGFLAAKRLPKNQRPRIVTSFHGFHSVNFYSGIMARGERVIAVSQCMKEHILENYPHTKENDITVIPNSVDTEQNFPEYRPSAEWLEKWYTDYPELKNKFTICLPGRITRIKGGLHLPPIIKALKEQGIPAHAVIVGETKKGKEALREEIAQAFAEAGLSADVTWTGHRRDLRDVLCVCDVTVSLTLQPESFGKTTLEALALGRPVAGYEHGGVGEQLDIFLPAGKVPTGNTDAMAALLSKWYHQRPTPKLPVAAPFRREDMIQSHIALYKELCQ